MAVANFRIFCIGRNYADHIAELRNAAPASPVIFLKPPSALVAPRSTIPFPTHGRDLHFETEIVVRIGRAGICQDEKAAASFIDALTLGFDLTLRDVQDDLKKKGLPWELAKAFDGSAPVGNFVPFDPRKHDLQRLAFRGLINGQVRQEASSSLMLFPISRLLVEISKAWKFQPGDLIFTGTPSGVGSLHAGDTLTAAADWCGEFDWKMA